MDVKEVVDLVTRLAEDSSSPTKGEVKSAFLAKIRSLMVASSSRSDIIVEGPKHRGLGIGEGDLTEELCRMIIEAGHNVTQQDLTFVPTLLRSGILPVAGIPVATRAFRRDGTVWLDVGDDRPIVVTPAGWAPGRWPEGVVFYRPKGFLPLSVGTGDPIRAAERFKDLFSLSDKALLRIVAWAATVIYAGASPVLLLTGPQGAGKTTLARAVVATVDPKEVAQTTLDDATVPILPWLGPVVLIDNVSSISAANQDMVCRLVTGEGLVKRRLYTDHDVVMIQCHLAMIITTIALAKLRPDLADRTVEVELSKPDRHRGVAEMMELYAAIQPDMTALVLDVVSKLLNESDLNSEYRIVEYAGAIEIASQTLGIPDDLKYSRIDMAVEAVTSTSFGEILYRQIEAGKRLVQATTRQVLSSVETSLGAVYPRDFPRSVRAAGIELKRLQPALQTLGIHCAATKNHRRETLWDIWAHDTTSDGGDPGDLNPVQDDDISEEF